jgi:ATP-dependent Clp protease ATP-binding subunit ClpA
VAFDALSAVAGPLLGRDAEVELLTRLLHGIGEVGSSLVLVGEPGIGKSRSPKLGIIARSELPLALAADPPPPS